METTNIQLGGRQTANLAQRLRRQMADGQVRAGEFLPGERELAAEHGVARKTVASAMSALEAEGLIRCVPRHGYRVMARAHDPTRGAPLAYVRTAPRALLHRETVHTHLLSLMEQLASPHSWSILAMPSVGSAPSEVLERLKSAGASGVILEVMDKPLLDLIAVAGMPAVCVDSWAEGAEIDAVVQDGFLGGLQAVKWLTARGHRRIGWFGLPLQTFQSRMRFSGVATGLFEAGLEIERGLCVESNDVDTVDAALKLLSRRDRPTAIVALWSIHAAAILKAAQQLKLKLYRDFDLVSWTTEEDYASAYRGIFPTAVLPPTVVWRVRDMAEAAMFRLVQRREHARLAAIQIRIPTRLEIAKGTPATFGR